MIRTTTVVAVLSLIAPSTWAEEPPLAKMESVLLSTGQPIRLRVAQNVTSTANQAGDLVALTALGDVTSGGRAVIKSGAPALGVLSAVSPSKAFGRGGGMAFAVRGVWAVDGSFVPLSGDLSVTGSDRAGNAAMGGLVGLALSKGGKASLRRGQEITAFVAADREIGPAEPPRQQPALEGRAITLTSIKVNVARGHLVPGRILFDFAGPAEEAIALDTIEAVRVGGVSLPPGFLKFRYPETPMLDAWSVVSLCSRAPACEIEFVGETEAGTKWRATSSLELTFSR